MTHRRQNFMGGAAILAGAVAVTKLLGALYKIPLGNLLDREGMAHFYAAYNIYSLLLVLSTAGLPVALSRMVSRAAAQRRYGAVRRCLHLGLALLAAVLGMAIMVRPPRLILAPRTKSTWPPTPLICRRPTQVETTWPIRSTCTQELMETRLSFWQMTRGSLT